MSRLNSINIRGFKILENVSLSLGNLNILTGINSSGKTSVIQAILFLVQNSSSIREKFFINKIINKIINNSKELENMEGLFNIIPKFNGNYLNLGNSKNIFNKSMDSAELSISVKDEEDRNIKVILSEEDVDNKFDIKFENFSSDFTNISTFLEIFDDVEYININRVISNINNISDSCLVNNKIGNNGEYAIYYLAEKGRDNIPEISLKHKNAKDNTLLENVNCWLSEISNDIRVNATFNSSINKAILTYSYNYDTINTTGELSPDYVGYGITYVLPIIIAILKSKRNSLLIMENPEAHLHPQGQAKIAELCALAASAGIQIILETHSDHFFNGIRVAIKKNIIEPEKTKLFYFERSTKKMSTNVYDLEIDNEGNINQDWPVGFFDEYEKLLDELLW